MSVGYRDESDAQLAGSDRTPEAAWMSPPRGSPRPRPPTFHAQNDNSEPSARSLSALGPPLRRVGARLSTWASRNWLPASRGHGPTDEPPRPYIYASALSRGEFPHPPHSARQSRHDVRVPSQEAGRQGSRPAGHRPPAGPVQLVLDLKLLELILIDSVTLSNGYGLGERAQSRPILRAWRASPFWFVAASEGLICRCEEAGQG
jgi:hypothetical protein